MLPTASSKTLRARGLYAAGHVTGYSGALHLRYPNLRAAQQGWDRACQAGRVGPRAEWGSARARELAQSLQFAAHGDTPRPTLLREVAQKMPGRVRAQPSIAQILPHGQVPSRPDQARPSATALRTAPAPRPAGGSSRRARRRTPSTPPPRYRPPSPPLVPYLTPGGSSRPSPAPPAPLDNHGPRLPFTASANGGSSSTASPLPVCANGLPALELPQLDPGAGQHMDARPPGQEAWTWYVVTMGAYPGVYLGM